MILRDDATTNCLMRIKILNKQFFKGQRLLLLAFLLLHTAASFYYISKQNITFDEPQYIEYAKRWLHGKPERVELLDDSKSPVVAICWIPRIVRQIVHPDYHLNDYGRKDQNEGRYMMIVFSLITALYVYWWCKELYGKNGWWLPLLLLLFDPLYLAYSTLITTDLACGAFLVALLYHYRKYLLYHQQKQLWLAAVYTGIAVITKQNMLFVIILLPVLSVKNLFSDKKSSFSFKRIFYNVALFSIIIIVVIHLSYYFYKSFIPFGNYSFESQTFRQLQHYFSFLHRLPVPLPQPYVQSLDIIKAHAELGAGKPLSTYNGVYLFGELKENEGFWYYYLVILFYKMPIGILLLIAASVVLFIRKFKTTFFVEKYMFLVIPIIFYLVILSFFNTFQIGIRHILFVFPLLYIGFGKLFYEVANAKIGYQISTAGAVVYSFISVAAYYPYIIPYTNEFINDKKMVYKKIGDSSIDYGQADLSVTDFIKDHREFKEASSSPAIGKFAVPMNSVLDLYLKNKSPYKWYQKLQPKGLYQYVILLYDIKQEDLIKAGLKE